MRIDSLELFLTAFRATPNATVCVSAEYYDEISSGTANLRILEVTDELMTLLLNLGILYLYGEAIEVNPMAIRVLDIMHSEKKILNKENFQREIDESKKHYMSEHPDDSFEAENLLS